MQILMLLNEILRLGSQILRLGSQILRSWSKISRLCYKIWGYIAKVWGYVRNFKVILEKLRFETEYLSYIIRTETLRLPLYKINSIILHKWKKLQLRNKKQVLTYSFFSQAFSRTKNNSRDFFCSNFIIFHELRWRFVWKRFLCLQFMNEVRKNESNGKKYNQVK